MSLADDTVTIVNGEEENNHTCDGCNCKPLMVDLQDIHNEICDIINEKNSSMAKNRIDILESKAKLSVITEIGCEYKQNSENVKQVTTDNLRLTKILNEKKNKLTKYIDNKELRIDRATSNVSTLYELLATLRVKYLGDDDDDDDDDDNESLHSYNSNDI